MAQKYNIHIDQGTTFTHNFVVKDASSAVIDLTGFTGRGQLRDEFESDSVVEFTITIPTPALGVVNAFLSDTQTDSLDADRYVYDIELVDSSGNVYRIVQGTATVYPGVTRILPSSSSSS